MKRRSNRGFTLLELLVAAIVVAILAAVAYPSFTEQVRKSRRADGTSSLAALRLAQEKWRANNTTYGTTADVWSTGVSPDGHYTIAVTANNATGYTATATPVGTQRADSCGILTVDQDGPEGTADHLRHCWNRTN